MDVFYVILDFRPLNEPSNNLDPSKTFFWKFYTTIAIRFLEYLFFILDINYTFFYKQSIFDPRPENSLSFSKKLPQKMFSNCLVDGLLTSIV